MINYIRNQTIRKKFILLIFAIAVFSVLLNLVIHRFILYQNYIKLEEHGAERDLKRARQAINRELYHLENLCHDWGSWDDTYSFVKTRSRNYVQSNLNFESFVSGNFDLIWIISNELITVKALGFDLKTGKVKVPALFPLSGRIRSNTLLEFNDKDPIERQGRSGIIISEYGIMMAAARPILTSRNAGPSRGFIVMGRYLSESIINVLKEQTEVNFSITAIKNGGLTAEDLGIIKNLASSMDGVFIRHDRSSVIAASLYPDIDGIPAFMIKAVYPRDISFEGFKVIIASLLFIFTGILCIIILMWIMLSHSVIKPIEQLKYQVKAIVTGDYDRVNILTSQDELGLLSLVIDDMAQTITGQTDELKDVNSRLEILSITDGLTGVFNRRHFDERIKIECERAARSGEHLSVIMCDIDFFKKYNDLYGHQAGDQCLIKVTRSMKSGIKRLTDEIYRYGGEEFIIMLPNTPADGALHVARSMLASVYNLGIVHSGSDKYGCVTLSAGISTVIPEGGVFLKDLISCADQALYEAKKRGRNRICVAETWEKGVTLLSEYPVEK